MGVYKRALGAGEIAQAEAYLQAKYFANRNVSGVATASLVDVKTVALFLLGLPVLARAAARRRGR